MTVQMEIPSKDALDKLEKRWLLRHNEIRSVIDEIKSIYAKSGINLNPSSQLFNFLKDSEELAMKWSDGDTSETNIIMLFNALHIDRIATAIRLFSLERDKDNYLKHLLNGTLDFFERKPSHAKSILWELEVWSKIKRVIPETYLEEPDVVVNLKEFTIAIPCKKIFSEKGVSKILSNAV